ncbi:glycoside hydrolase family 88 protein [Wenyingzhuangia sp. 1_MG-2023]|nr:glycoside hydrolase family 88 protein [Wenyingzhuangia sp. 1_MG-2023]
MKIYKIILSALLTSGLILSCNTAKKTTSSISQQISLSEKQFSLLVKDANQAHKIPRTLDANGEMHFTHDRFDWTEGFFPGSCWYLYALTKDEKWKKEAIKFQKTFESHKDLTTNHDLGFVFNCSYGNGFRFTQNKAYKQVMIDAAKALSTRFNPTVGCIKSWDVQSGWQATRGWEYPVIIDNMMNLELLFEVSLLTGDDTFKNIAISHADTTLKNHYREDDSSYHVIDYDPETGNVRNKHTAQGFTHESSWARGQAWGLYGYTICYRYTRNPVYLEQAQKIATYILNYKGTPDDGIPYWDYNAPNIPKEPRDVSAAAVTVSALIELDKYSNNSYQTNIYKIMNALASDEYFAKTGKNKHFLLKHSTGSIPHNNEIDVPLNYADYYYLEALYRLQNSK